MLRAPIPLVLLALWLAACGPDPGSPRGGGVRPAVHVRVATWNVQDLFDAEDRLVPPGADDLVPSELEVSAKLSLVAAVLLRVDADLVLLQEVESRAVLERLAVLASYPSARLVDGNDPRGIDVAVLSRLPLRGYVSHAGDLGPDGRLLWPRDCIEARADARGRTLVVVGSHFSSALSDGGTRRAWQAARLREIADRSVTEEPSALVLAGGDLNDVPTAAALAPLLEDGAWVDPAPVGTPTWYGRSGAARLDYLLVPAPSAGSVVAAWIETGPEAAAASDHRPLVLDLRLE
jgi:endonuclease/exonuclease/phosphatase family metal-dependent hydrolase